MICSLYGVGCVSVVDCDYVFCLVVVRCLLFVGLLFIVCSLRFTMRVVCWWLLYLACFCVLIVDCCSLIVARCALFVVCYLLLVGS